jgi:hypothetical protein
MLSKAPPLPELSVMTAPPEVVLLEVVPATTCGGEMTCEESELLLQLVGLVVPKPAPAVLLVL